MTVIDTVPALCGSCFTVYASAVQMWRHLDHLNRCPRSPYGRTYGPNVEAAPDYESPAPAPRQPRDPQEPQERKPWTPPQADLDAVLALVRQHPGISKHEVKTRMGWNSRRVYGPWVYAQRTLQAETDQKEAA